MGVKTHHTRFLYPERTHTGANLSQKFLETLKDFGVTTKVSSKILLFVYNLLLLIYKLFIIYRFW